MSHSQSDQDTYLIENIFPKKLNGYFIELGAADGIMLSNTLMLEQKYGWSGICIEPNTEYYNKLKHNRNVNTVCVNELVYSKNDIKMEFVNAMLLSGIINTISRGYLKNKQRREQLDFAENNTVIKTTKTLTTVLDENNAPKNIDYLSLDTEGSEYDILLGFDFTKYTIGYICVEHNNKTKDRNNIKQILLKNGYSLHRENGIDDEYIHSSLKK